MQYFNVFSVEWCVSELSNKLNESMILEKSEICKVNKNITNGRNNGMLCP